MFKTIGKYLSIIAVFAMLISIVSVEEVSASSPLIDQYLRFDSIARNSDGSIRVDYTMLKTWDKDLGGSATIPLQIGYSWPSQYRGALKDYYVKANYSKGSHVLTIPKPGAYVGTLSVQAKVNANRYNEVKGGKSIFHYPDSTKRTAYYEISGFDAGASFFIYSAAPAVYFEFSPLGKWGKVVGRTYLGWSLWEGYNQSQSIGFPTPVKGHYYETTSWYSGNGLNIRVKVYVSRSAFNKKETPIFDATRTYKF
ncbi:hypothetical protein HP570_05240 [Brevibacillus sp. RS1.1]|uniref:hypothetical protein n=1 Tax=Brevibacillus sp. RS1.1 TaxID=2738982 RepID=UPI00156B9218|nr:hypothetical protein [Brevibacillus sp. RS1.1]NRR01632.1 hypothetical protein [Brevibacillus sp. RS1.1]